MESKDWIAICAIGAAIVIALANGVLATFLDALKRRFGSPKLCITFDARAQFIARTPKALTQVPMSVRTQPEVSAPTPTPVPQELEVPTPTPVPEKSEASAPMPDRRKRRRADPIDVDWWWVRLSVRNEDRRFTRAGVVRDKYRWRSTKAEEVEVYVQRIEKKRGERFEDLPDHIGFNLKWSWGGNTVHADLLPGVTKFLHIGHLTEPSFWDHSSLKDYRRDRKVDLTKALFILAASPRNPNDDHVLESGTYRLHLVIGGKNVPSGKCLLTLHFDGRWPETDKQVWDFLTVSIEETVRIEKCK